MAITFRPDPEPAEALPPSGVGHDLRTARETMGKTLEECAQQLRIRHPFLLALEETRFKDLPGGTYAVGFLRTYAEFLGLDGEEMVRRFRQEAAADLGARSELVFPSPVSEGRIPTGGIVFVGLVVAILGYGAWYMTTSHEDQKAELTPQIPDRLATVLNRPAQVTGDAKPPEAAKPVEETKSPDGEPPKIGKEGEIVPPSEGEEDKANQAATDAAPPSAQAGPAPESTKPESTKPEPAKPEPATTEPAKTGPAKAEAPPPAPQAEPTSADASAAPAVGAVYGTEGESRITLKASGDDCWVQVSELDGQLLVSRLLRSGDTFRVPDRPGLTLTVGNAAALEVLVDGRAAGPLGKAGQVRRDIRLDPDKLLAGG